MIYNGIQVSILDGGKPIEEIRRPEDGNELKRYLEVVPGMQFAIRVTLLNGFKFGRYKNADIDCMIDKATVDYHGRTTIVKPRGFKSGILPPPWKVSAGRFWFGQYDSDCYVHFAFGRDMNTIRGYGDATEHFKDRGTISVAVGCGGDWTKFEFIYATRAILLQEGVLTATSTQHTSRCALTQNLTGVAITKGMASEAKTRESDGNSTVRGSVKKKLSATKADVSRDSTFQHANELARVSIVTTTRSYYDVDKVDDGPSKKLDMSSDGSAIPAKTSIQDQAPLTAQQETNAVTPNINDRSVEFAERTARARTKARALAELRLEEMEVKEQQLQLKLEKIQSKRELLELDGDE